MTESVDLPKNASTMAEEVDPLNDTLPGLMIMIQAGVITLWWTLSMFVCWDYCSWGWEQLPIEQMWNGGNSGLLYTLQFFFMAFFSVTELVTLCLAMTGDPSWALLAVPYASKWGSLIGYGSLFLLSLVLHTYYAEATLVQDGGSGVTGTMRLVQDWGQSVHITGDIYGASAGSHGFHVHELGTISSGCSGAGGHYNPTNKNHGGPLFNDRHVGDLGNVVTDSSQVTNVDIWDGTVDLYGDYSVIDRAFVFHAAVDDYSGASGNAGAREACGTINSETGSIFFPVMLGIMWAYSSTMHFMYADRFVAFVNAQKSANIKLIKSKKAQESEGKSDFELYVDLEKDNTDW